MTPEEFARIILKRGHDGQLVYLGDVAKLELGGQSHTSMSYQDGVIPSVAILIYQLPGSNELKTAGLVKSARAKKNVAAQLEKREEELTTNLRSTSDPHATLVP